MDDECSIEQTDLAVRAAYEGIPVGAIARILRRPFGEVHKVLAQAMVVGKISELPKADWPPGAKWETRLPTVPRTYNADDLEFHCRKTFKLTPLEAGFMSVLVRYDCADKERLHNVVESQRQKRQNRPDNQELTELKIVDVIVCKLRKKLRALARDVEITTSWGRGYYFEPAAKAKIFELIGGTYASGPDTGRRTCA